LITNLYLFIPPQLFLLTSSSLNSLLHRRLLHSLVLHCSAESLCLAPTALTTNQELWKSGNSMENKTLLPIFVALFTADNIASLTSFLGFIFLNFFVSFTPYFLRLFIISFLIYSVAFVLIHSVHSSSYSHCILTIHRCGMKKMGEREKKYVHMLNATLCATGRAICCLLETYQVSTLQCSTVRAHASNRMKLLVT
jgi:hypothetical protein